MTTERMTDERWDALRNSTKWTSRDERDVVNEMERARRVEQEQAEKIRKLEDMLRLANDKMAERVRQARWEVADSILRSATPMHEAVAIRGANAPKD